MRVGAPDSISVKVALVGETPRDAILVRHASALRSEVCNVLRYKLQNPIRLHCPCSSVKSVVEKNILSSLCGLVRFIR